jgi:ElaB/YqjD/DUF883 family membrane-anchored ribosome-binding protein
MARKQATSRISKNAKRKVRAMRSDFNAWQKDMRGTMDGIGEATREARHAMGGAIERLENWGEDNLPGVAEAVRSQPFKACAISLGAGALIGALLLR